MSKDYFKAKASQPALDPVSLPDSHNAAAHFRRIGTKPYVVFSVEKRERGGKGCTCQANLEMDMMMLRRGKGARKARWNETENGGKCRKRRENQTRWWWLWEWEKRTRNIEKSTRLTHNEGQVYPLHSLRYALPFGPPKIRPYRNRNVQPKARSAVINNP